jgi:sRNA-binding carbon storage regulator CsrA
MEHEEQKTDDDQPVIKAGYLVIRLKPGWGVMVNNIVEVRVSTIRSMGEVHIAIRAPKDMPIRKVK